MNKKKLKNGDSIDELYNHPFKKFWLLKFWKICVEFFFQKI